MSLRMKKKKLGSFHALSAEPPENIPQNQDIIIIIHKGKVGLGLGIVGGSDTYVSGIVVSEIDPDGVAAKDGRLKVGDQLLAVNGVSLHKVPHKEAVSIMRMTSSPVSLRVVREEPENIFTTDQEPTIFFTVIVKKSLREPFGMSIMARRGGGGIFVTKVEEDSLIDIEGTIQQGDRLMQINGEDITGYSQERAAQFLKRMYGEIDILVGRIPSLATSLIKETERRKEIEELEVNKLKDKREVKWSDDDKENEERRRSQSDGCGNQPYVAKEHDDDTMTHLKSVPKTNAVSSKDCKNHNDINKHLFHLGKCEKEDYV